ncbi:MAG TPA: hypothetical protein VLK37_06715 [Solirubrobacterales bacterium]|nr:hypothetical protein [Solirubrobacterales bacterium]
MASPDIAGGNAGGLLAFMDFMIDKGYGSAGAIGPWKSAAKQVFSIVEGDDFESLDVRSLDIDEYMDRFQNRTIGKYSAESLRAYRQRFRKAVEAYRAYLADPNWRPSLKRTARPKKGDAGSPKRSKATASTSSPTEAATPPVPSAPTASLIAYPFPLKSGQMAQLHLPAKGLDREDADRLTHFLRALVFDQPAQIGPGAADEDE